ncbi:DUF3263 domain-containing protein [Agilicoccus flavus]|uniref:DUF3263 domain-containing protein n=1 Tax=Agilicoccus flavus TaxID=2775968 RepID=UPI001CF6CF9F|nr:DUF3263 domain-containing protein [Agilicoccus flavus]
MEIRRRSRPALSRRDQGVLDLERRFGHAAATADMKFAEAERTLGLTRAGYMLVLTALVEDPAAQAHDPETIAKLRAVRSADGDPGAIRRY